MSHNRPRALNVAPDLHWPSVLVLAGAQTSQGVRAAMMLRTKTRRDIIELPREPPPNTHRSHCSTEEIMQTAVYIWGYTYVHLGIHVRTYVMYVRTYVRTNVFLYVCRSEHTHVCAPQSYLHPMVLGGLSG